VDQAGDVEHREGDHLTPGQRVTDSAVQRIRTVFREPDDVRRRLDAGQTPAQAGDPRAGQDHAEPERHAAVEPSLEQIERQRTGRDEEHPDPDRPVRQTVAEFVARPDGAIGRELDAPRVSDLLLIGRR
jgi:hypothetical protein